MEANVERESDVHAGIEETLLYINEVTLQIKTELRMILGLLKEGGPLHTSIDKANQKLILKAKEMGINVKEIMDDIDDGNDSQLVSPHIRMLLGLTEEIARSVGNQNIAE